MKFKTSFLFLLFFLLPAFAIIAQERRYTVSGTITDSQDGEDLAGAGIQVRSSNLGTVTNPYGFYSLNLPGGEYILEVSYMGYNTKQIPVTLNADVRMNISLDPSTSQLDEVVITAEARNANITRMEMSTERLSVKEIKTIPALMGEVDVIKAIQLLPGVQPTAKVPQVSVYVAEAMTRT
ncbi:MAG: carboxypeptidase-like regulatory domain-containing protein [Tannerellaceae bacterium]|nr:carboxypeptidase-like regulatory domain-containing protein [Tannerellaceae bacterium]